MLTVPLLLLLLFALPLGLIPVQLVLRLGVQLLWQERLQGKTDIKRIYIVMIQSNSVHLPPCLCIGGSFINLLLVWDSGQSRIVFCMYNFNAAFNKPLCNVLTGAREDAVVFLHQ